MTELKNLFCPLCGNNAHIATQNDREDWINISCTYTNCLRPSTGLGTKTTNVALWLHYQNKFKLVILRESSEKDKIDDFSKDTMKKHWSAIMNKKRN